jgi:GH24 family phage-related lysozyme (muramidase)
MKEVLKRQEGLSLKAYPDAGGWAIGYGHNFTHGIPNEAKRTVEYRPIEERDKRMEISLDFAEYLFEMDIDMAVEDLLRVFGKGFISGFPPDEYARCAALIILMFNLGATRFEGFREMIMYVKAGQWSMAALEVIDSKAGREYPSRYRELAVMLGKAKWEER